MSSAFSEHEYEPISPPSLPTTLSTLNAQRILNTAPVVRFNDTDVAHVADSDDSTDAQERRYNPNLVLDGDPVVPLDGEIEDNAMQARELGGTGDTSEDQETAQQLQDRLEERFLTAATPCTESRTDAEINTSQVDTSALEEQPLQRGARGFPQRLRSQAGKLRTRLRGIQRPTFSLQLERKKTDKTKTTKAEKPNKDEKPKPAEKSRFSLPDRPKFNLPERPKFNFPERPKFSMPERPKFNIKKPNINLPSLGRVKKPLKERQHSSESNSSTKRNIFDFSTYPRIFDKKSKNRGEYATSSPKASRAQSPESATVPRVKKKVPIGARWVQRFSDIKYADDEPDNAVERSKPWRQPSIEEPQIAFRQETPESRGPLPWEESDDRSVEPSNEKREEEFNDELRGEERNAGYEEDSVEVDNRRIIVTLPLGPDFLGNPPEDSDDKIDPNLSDPRLYPRRMEEDSFEKVRHKLPMKENWRPEEEQDEEEVLEESIEADEVEDHGDYRKGDKIPRQDSYGREDYSGEIIPDDEYGGNFLPIDPRKYLARESTPDETSIRSDREQQSSGSSSDRRRRGVLEEIDSDEFFLRAKGISQDDMNMGRFLASEIRDAFRPTGNALADQEFDLAPPTRPVRTRSLRKTRREETTPEVYNATPPARPKRDRRRSEDSMRVDEYETFLPEKTHGSISGSRHRIIYQAEETPPPAVEPLDDIVVVKPARRKSRSVARSYSEFGSELFQPPPLPPTPPVAPRRRKRGRREIDPGAAYVNGHGPVPTFCNGHRRELEWPHGIGGFPPEDRNHDEILDREELENFASRLDHEYIEPAPVAPKRKSRSRGTSVADDDRTSRGAESLPEVSYLEEEETAPQEPEGDPPGYAVVDKREKPPRPPPPRRRRDKFATTPRSHATPPTPDIPSVPVRPRRAYSTLGPSRRRSSSEDRSVNQMDVTPYTELDDVSDDPDSRDLQSGQVLNKIQGRPLPAPPRPPRARRDAPDQVSISSNGVLEVAASTQTDPLPDDMVIEEEVTRAKLVMAPSRSGSQILVSTERIASPTFERQSSQASMPPLPRSVSPERFVEPSDEVEVEVEIAEIREAEDREARHLTPASPTTSLPFQQEDRIRIASLEVADLRVERLNVNVIETQKVSASEVDAVVVSASEISSTANLPDPGIHPSLLKELIAIRSHLEQAAAARNQGRESTLEIARSEDPPLSAVDELIEALKNSDRSEERSDEVIEESEIIDDPKMLKDEFSEPEKSLDQKPKEQSVEIDQPVKNIPDTAIADVELVQENLHAEILDEKTSSVEETRASASPHDSSAPDSAPTLSLTPTENQETLKAHAPTSLTNSAAIPSLNTPKEEDRPSNRVSREGKEDKRKSSRSRSPSPTIDGKRPVRQTASPVRSLPPVISVTPDIPDAVPSPIPEAQTQPQRGIISYTRSGEEETGPGVSPSLGGAQFVAFPTSQIPASFFSLASPVDSRSEIESEPGLVETTQQLLRALRIAGTRAMRHFVGYIASRVSTEDRGEKIKEIELALCALLLLIAGLLIMCFGSPRTVTHYHHWDYFNPPQ